MLNQKTLLNKLLLNLKTKSGKFNDLQYKLKIAKIKINGKQLKKYKKKE